MSVFEAALQFPIIPSEITVIKLLTDTKASNHLALKLQTGN
jgi:hypothetical protein